MKLMVKHNPLKPEAKELCNEVVLFFEKKGIELAKEKDERVDFLITIGGDGTILYHKNRYIEDKVPVFAIGSNTSYICQANRFDWKKKLESILENGYTIEQKTMIDVFYEEQKMATVLNEVLVRNVEPRILFFDVQIYDVEEVARYKFRADGFIVATPTGSSGHSYSCFAEEIKEASGKFVLAALAPYRRAFLPLYLPNSYSVKINVSAPYSKSHVVCDGLCVFNLMPEDSVRISKSESTFGFVYPKE